MDCPKFHALQKIVCEKCKRKGHEKKDCSYAKILTSKPGPIATKAQHTETNEEQPKAPPVEQLHGQEAALTGAPLPYLGFNYYNFADTPNTRRSCEDVDTTRSEMAARPQQEGIINPFSPTANLMATPKNQGIPQSVAQSDTMGQKRKAESQKFQEQFAKSSKTVTNSNLNSYSNPKVFE